LNVGTEIWITVNGGDPLSLQLSSRPDAAKHLRRALEKQFGPRLSHRGLQDLASVLSELVNNSVIHGPGAPIRVRLEVRPNGGVRGEVEDDGNGEVAMREIVDDFGEGGLGLRLVDALVDRWGVYDGSTHVWFEMSGLNR
jgi:anti-sigma regulatory factor (Ser/Thr protein kinase)